MFTSQKIGRMVFIWFYFDKILIHANAIDRIHVNARENEPLITVLSALFLVFNKNFLQAATRETRLQMLKIEQKHRMTSCTWDRGCSTKSVIDMIDHRTLDDIVSVIKHMIMVDRAGPINGWLASRRWKMNFHKTSFLLRVPTFTLPKTPSSNTGSGAILRSISQKKKSVNVQQT